MVNLTNILLRKSPFNVKLDPNWRRRQVLKLSAHFYGRMRNCFSIAIRRVQRSLQNVARGRDLRKRSAVDLWDQRITAGCQELGYMPQGCRTMMEGLNQSQILLSRQTLANLAIWEPRTFKSLNKLAAIKANDPDSGIGVKDQLGPNPLGVVISKEKLLTPVNEN